MSNINLIQVGDQVVVTIDGTTRRCVREGPNDKHAWSRNDSKYICDILNLAERQQCAFEAMEKALERIANA